MHIKETFLCLVYAILFLPFLQHKLSHLNLLSRTRDRDDAIILTRLCVVDYDAGARILANLPNSTAAFADYRTGQLKRKEKNRSSI